MQYEFNDTELTYARIIIAEYLREHKNDREGLSRLEWAVKLIKKLDSLTPKRNAKLQEEINKILA